jgi:hypothetical protein
MHTRFPPTWHARLVLASCTLNQLRPKEKPPPASIQPQASVPKTHLGRAGEVAAGGASVDPPVPGGSVFTCVARLLRRAAPCTRDTAVSTGMY